jgi:F5/8 type C domain/Dolichyl-phosphate-mannose-protein mannosyltransferase
MRTVSLGRMATRVVSARVPVVRWPALGLHRVGLSGALGPAAALGVGFFLVRVLVALSPPLRETYYDEALTGLMSLQILRGVPQVFYWGQPYLGAVDAYIAAAAFYLFGPSTFALRLAAASVSALWMWAAWRIGRHLAGAPWGLLAGVQIVLPPIFLTFVQLSSHAEGVAMALGTVTLAAAVWLVDAPLDRRPRLAWVLLGVAAGLAWWTSQMATMLLGAAAVGLLVARPAVLRGPGPYAALGLFGLASLPFWVWNARHEWATFHHLLEWGEPLPGFSIRVEHVAVSLARTLRDTYWDGREAPLPGWASLLGWVVVGTVYVPAVGLAVSRLVVWARRLATRTRPWTEPLDLVALAFWLTVLAQLFTWFGTSGIIRYSLTFYGPLPLLVVAVLARLAGLGRTGRAAALTLAGLLVTFNVITHVSFLRDGAGRPVRPVDAAIAQLEAFGTRACYADSRIAQVISFESSERIVCADYAGLRNYDALRTVDRVDAPEKVAIVTHRVMKGPDPREMAIALARIGGRAQQAVVGDYVIFHHFVPPNPAVRPIPTADWHVRASTASADASLAFDREVWTRWVAPKRPGEWIEVDFGQTRQVTQVSLLAAPWVADTPVGLRVETSDNAQSWQTVAATRDGLVGLHWWHGHPRLDASGRLVIRFAPRSARYVRLTSVGPEWPGAQWSITELFLYETADSAWTPAPAAVSALATAAAEFDHWRDDPTGPNPLRAPYTAEHRRAQVRWGPTFDAMNDALAAAPDWEEPHNFYGLTLAVDGWGRGLEWGLDQARRDGAWREVLLFAGLIDAHPDEAWRAGRVTAQIEALDRLGRTAEAAVLRSRPDPIPAQPLHVRFGKDLELTGVDTPAPARAGETVRLSYHWRLVETTGYDYWVFLHVAGLSERVIHDELVGPHNFGVSHWQKGERVRQTITFTIPPDTRPGTYLLRVGVWLPSTGRRLHVLSAAVPQARRAVTLGSLVVQ